MSPESLAGIRQFLPFLSSFERKMLHWVTVCVRRRDFLMFKMSTCISNSTSCSVDCLKIHSSLSAVVEKNSWRYKLPCASVARCNLEAAQLCLTLTGNCSSRPALDPPLLQGPHIPAPDVCFPIASPLPLAAKDVKSRYDTLLFESAKIPFATLVGMWSDQTVN